MKKIEDIPKKSIFEVPDGYFDKLPGIIQSKVAQTSRPAKAQAFTGIRALRYALPAIVFLVASIFVYQNFFTRTSSDPETMLASVDSQDLVEYLEEGEIPMEEILEDINQGEINPEDFNTMEMDFTEKDLLNLSDELENEQL